MVFRWHIMVTIIGFLVNPIAGMGGKVGLKGTDGVVDKALKLGAVPVAPGRAKETLTIFQSTYGKKDNITWVTCAGEMGSHQLKEVHITNFLVAYTPSATQTSSQDTKSACKQLMKYGVDLILFCGGDGTARDIFSVVQDTIPMLGIPAGVKMHSGVFGITPNASAKILHEFVHGHLTLGDAEILDLDEDRYRKGEWNIRLFGIAKGIVEPTYVQIGKASFESVSENDIRDELAEHIGDEMDEHPETLFFFGSGGTIEYIAQKLGIKNTLLGIDAIYQKKTIGTDINEQQILNLLEKYSSAKLILSPIGAQGFILGRGNLQLSPAVITAIGVNNIIVISTPSKLLSTPIIRIDTGDAELDKRFAEKELMMVLIGYRLSRVVKIQVL